MKNLLKFGSLSTCAAAAVLAVGVMTTSVKAAVIDLGFAVDASGSIGSGNFTTIKNALSAALSVIPTSGANTYRVSVVSFSTSAQTVITQTITNAADLAAVQTAVAGMGYSGGTTCISCATTNLTNAFTGLGGLGDLSIMNIVTDGEPNVGTTNGTTLRSSLTGAGWDAISAEAIGSFNLSFLGNLVSPNPGVVVNNVLNLPNPLTQGFILTLADANAYAAAIGTKVQKVIDNVDPVPVPAALPLLATALGVFGFTGWRKRKAAAK